jgi:hypothetical protein
MAQRNSANNPFFIPGWLQSAVGRQPGQAHAPRPKAAAPSASPVTVELHSEYFVEYREINFIYERNLSVNV